MKKEKIEEDLEKLKVDIKNRGEEIEKLKKTIEELNTKIRSNEGTGRTTELSDMLGEVSELLDASFNIFGISSRGRSKSGRDRGLVGLIDNIGRLAEKSESFQKKFDLNGKEGVIDFRIRSGTLKKPTVKHTGLRIKKQSKKRADPHRESSNQTTIKPIEGREPIVDIFEEEDKVIVMVELPGVTEKDIVWDVEGDTLRIRASTPERNYLKEIVLPAAIEKKEVKSTYMNGIFEITLEKTLTERTKNL